MRKIGRGEKKEETENDILLFLFFGSFEKIFLLKMFLKIQPNTFSSSFLYFR